MNDNKNLLCQQERGYSGAFLVFENLDMMDGEWKCVDLDLYLKTQESHWLLLYLLGKCLN